MNKVNKYGSLILIFIFLISGCDENFDSKIWEQTTGKIVNIEKIPDGSYGFELIYEIKPNDFINEKRKPVWGPISIYYLSVEKEPLAAQTLKLKYMRKEPAVYKLLDRIQYRK